MLGLSHKIKCHIIFDGIHQYKYCDIIVGVGHRYLWI